MSIHYNAHRLGWLQMSILALVWNTERYGLEILRQLNVEGNNMKSSQIYPALKKLTEAGALKVRNVTENNSTKRYYTTTEAGKELVKHYIIDFLNVFYRMIFDKISVFIEPLCKGIDIQAGMNVLDLSSEIFDSVIQDFSLKTGITGHYFLKASDNEHAQIIRDRIDYLHIEQNVQILTVNHDSISLPSETVDYVIALFSFHETGSDWILTEGIRSLKKGGKMAIVEMELYPNFFFQTFVQELIPNHLTIGMDFSGLLNRIERINVSVLQDRKMEGIRFLLLEKLS